MKNVLKYWREVVLGLVAAGIFFVINALEPQWTFLSFALGSPIFDLGTKLHFFVQGVAGFFTLAPLDTAILAVASSVLVGINVGLATLLVRRQMGMQRIAGLSGLGALVGMLGVGCSSCGSVALFSILGATGASSFVSVLPLKGLEFSILSIVLLLASIVAVIVRLRRPVVCAIPNQ